MKLMINYRVFLGLLAVASSLVLVSCKTTDSDVITLSQEQLDKFPKPYLRNDNINVVDMNGDSVIAKSILYGRPVEKFHLERYGHNKTYYSEVVRKSYGTQESPPHFSFIMESGLDGGTIEIKYFGMLRTDMTIDLSKISSNSSKQVFENPEMKVTFSIDSGIREVRSKIDSFKVVFK